MSDEYNNEDILNENKDTVINDSSKRSKSRSDASSKNKGKKPVRVLLRVLILVVLFCVVVFAGIIVSDVLFGEDSSDREPEIIAVTVSGDTVILNDDQVVTLTELKAYLNKADSRGHLVTVALINDTGNPADIELYNQIVDLLAEYEIFCEKMTVPASADEVHTTNVYEFTTTDTTETEASTAA